jgi:hypothetical protein
MKTFYLKVGEEIVNQVRVSSIEEAISYFASVKKLTESELLRIFTVTIE